MYLNGVKTILMLHGVLEDVRVMLLKLFLTQRGRIMLCGLPSDRIATYAGMKAALLHEFKLSSKEYIRPFNHAIKLYDEMLVQCNTILRTVTMWHFYMDTRAVNDFNSSLNLLIADRLRELMSSDMRKYVVERKGIETLSPVALAELAERHMNEISEIDASKK